MEDDQQFCLRWNNHQSTLVAVFDTLLENGTLVDCTLAAEGKYLNAHKVVLSACSPYFESLLSQNYDKHPIFILKDVKFQELKAMMDYMYRGEVNISQDQLGALLKAAESLQIKGLSDNKKETEPRKSAPPAPAKSPPPTASTNLPRVQGLTIEQRRGNRSMDEREGSLSPGPRKRKRMRRRSTDDLDNHHDASNSSESHSNPPIQNIPIALPPASSKLTNADVPEPVETKSEILSRHKVFSNNDSEAPQVPIIKEKLETHTELMLEPKAEYVEEMNEDSIEDLTLDDDDVSNLDMSNDGAGPSHGNAGEGSSQGFGGWHMGNQSQDEVFLAAQEAVGAHRDSQGITSTSIPNVGAIELVNIKSEPGNLVQPNDSKEGLEFIVNGLSNNQLKELVTSLQSQVVNVTAQVTDLKGFISNQFLKLHNNLNAVLRTDISYKDTSAAKKDSENRLPLKNKEQLELLDGWLKLNEENRLLMLEYLSGIGGSDAPAVTRRVLNRIFTKSFAQEVNYSGQNNKVQFSSFELFKVVKEAVKLHHVAAGVTENVIEDKIKDWFRFAKGRNRNAGSQSSNQGHAEVFSS